MKKVIDGKMYNTDTADFIHDWDNGFYGNDFKTCEESLYQTKKGAFFLAGSGGPMSKYAESCGNMVCNGDGIEPISKKEAIRWLESHDGSDVLEKMFADEIEEA